MYISDILAGAVGVVLQVRQLGQGSYGTVKLVLNLQNMHLYAIKFISKRNLRSPIRFAIHESQSVY